MCTSAWPWQCLLKEAGCEQCVEQWGLSAVDQVLIFCSEAVLNSLLLRSAVVHEADRRSSDMQAASLNLHRSESSPQR
jgi:hypothetical protein